MSDFRCTFRGAEDFFAVPRASEADAAAVFFAAFEPRFNGFFGVSAETIFLEAFLIAPPAFPFSFDPFVLLVAIDVSLLSLGLCKK
jgi:hypothetical protein